MIVLNDLTMGSHVDGSAVICGSYFDDGGAVFGMHFNSSTTSVNDLTLQINGAFNPGADFKVKVTCGSMLMGNPPTRSISGGGVQWRIDGYVVELQCGNNNGAVARQNASLNGTCNSISNSLIALSQDLKSRCMAGNSAVNSVDGSIKFIVNQVDCNGVAVFNVNASDTILVLNKRLELVLNIGNVNFVVVNVYGTTIIQPSGNQIMNTWCNSNLQNGCSSVLWNFPDATTFQLADSGYGSMLAPYASSASTQTVNFNGAIVMKNLHIKGETHLPALIAPPCGGG